MRISVCRSTAAVFLATLLRCIVPGAGLAEEPAVVRLVADGRALLPVVVAADASDRVRQAAQTLAAYLGRISDARFEVRTGDGTTGLALGLPAHFPTVPIQKPWDVKDPTRREDYLLRSHPQGVYLLGASDLAVEHAVWDFLYRLGHRQFFPGETWEVVPHTRDLRIAVDTQEHPSYYARRIWYGYGAADYARQPYADWCARNRAAAGIELRSGHAYDGILQRNKAEFARHPEYLGLVGGRRKSSKFCISNPGLRQLVVADALAQFARDPSLPSISVEPSDGGGWCECEQCRALGSISDRAVLLANEVAAAVEAKYPGKYIGMYAYSQHSPPPTIRVHPRVVIGVATAFVSGGYTVDQLLDGWHRQGATLGIREYYSVHPWDRDLPGAARGGKPDYLKATIPHFYAKGARFLSAESGDNWGPNGLGYYLATRMLWDVREADRIDALKADFLEKAFGPAKEPMAGFYRLIDGANRPRLTDDLIGRMYRALAEAQQKTDNPKIRARLNDLTLYARYVELWSDYATAGGTDRQQRFETLLRFAYRIGPTMMIHTRGLARDLPRRDKTITLPKEAAANVPAGKNPWKDTRPFTQAEIDALLASGIAARKLIDFQPVAFSDRLVPAAKLGLPTVPTGSMGLYSRGVRTYFTWIDQAPATLELKAKAGVIYGNRGAASLALYPAAEVEGKAVARATVPPDKQAHDVALKTASAGLHRLEVSDQTAGTTVTWPEGLTMMVRSSPEFPADFHGRWSLYFYVPKGTKVVGGYASGVGTLLDGDGRKVYDFGPKPHYFRVPVAPGQDGKLWKFHNSTGQRLLMTVPPYLARNAKELLLPAEVVEADAP